MRIGTAMSEITIKESLELLKEKIRLVRIDSNGEWVFKCPFCGDSENPYHAHLYVSEKSGLMNCFKCETKGSINRLLSYVYDNKYKAHIEMDSNYKRSGCSITETSLGFNRTSFEKYISDFENLVEVTDSFDISSSISEYSNFMPRHKYMEDRIIRDDKSRELMYRTNMAQKLYSYYSEYYMNKLIKAGAVSDRMYNFGYKHILDTNMSIVFFGFNKTLNIFKTDCPTSKYVKFKRNVITSGDSDRDFFTIVNMRKHKGINDVFKNEYIDVYFCEGVYDAINLYLYNPSYATSVEPDIIVATGSKVSYASALFYIMDTYMKPVISHCFLDPDIDPKRFRNKYRGLRNFYKSFIMYKNGEYDYGDIHKNSLDKVRICGI